MQHRFAWRYLVGFVHPASGRTLFHLATSVSIPLFEAELAIFARAVGAGPRKQIVLILDQAGWHTSVKLRVPEHVHLLFLPPYSPELQPAEHLWPLTNEALVNQHFVSIEALEDAQLTRCAALQAQPAVIRSTTCFHWWPKQIHKRRGPRRNRYQQVIAAEAAGEWSAIEASRRDHDLLELASRIDLGEHLLETIKQMRRQGVAEQELLIELL